MDFIMNQEIWKNIPGYEQYQVSNLGNIRSLDRYITQKRCKFNDHHYNRFMKGKNLKPYIVLSNNKYPHYSVTLSMRKKFLVHRLVLLTFAGSCPQGMECCHNDGNGLNNRLDNLRWDTPKNNQLDRHKHGTIAYGHFCGSNHPFAKLTESDVLYIRSVPYYKNKRRDMCIKFNLSRSTMHAIITRKTWRHI